MNGDQNGVAAFTIRAILLACVVAAFVIPLALTLIVVALAWRVVFG